MRLYLDVLIRENTRKYHLVTIFNECLSRQIGVMAVAIRERSEDQGGGADQGFAEWHGAANRYNPNCRFLGEERFEGRKRAEKRRPFL